MEGENEWQEARGSFLQHKRAFILARHRSITGDIGRSILEEFEMAKGSF